jgi:predicted Zn-dependent protease
MGPHSAPYALDDFAAWLKSKYALELQILPPTTLSQSAWDDSRKQYVAELLLAQIKREHPDLAASPDAVVIGFTDADMYSVQNFWQFNNTQRNRQDRTGVISSAHLQGTIEERRTEKSAGPRLQQRLRRMLLKDVAVLYWKLPLNNDPSSLLQTAVDPNLPVDDIYASDA